MKKATLGGTVACLVSTSRSQVSPTTLIRAVTYSCGTASAGFDP
jgi:hypothetical protein